MSSRILFVLSLVVCCLPFTSPMVALILGIVVVQLFGSPFKKLIQQSSTILLQVAVVGLGFGMNAEHAMAAGREGFVFTSASIAITLFLGMLVGRAFGVERKTSHLISCGTAICGGSAIAAMSPVVQADHDQSSVALGTVFILNSIALLIFPSIGIMLHLSQHQFGLWAAVAIHDTSSVVAAAASYGSEALATATTVKLARALWIIPVALVTAAASQRADRKIRIPWFIGFFVIATCLNTYVPFLSGISPHIVVVSKIGLTLSLFLIGCGMSGTAFRSIGWMPLMQGALIWVIISIASLFLISKFVT